MGSSDVLGTWAEDYSAFPDFASEGGAYYTFKADGYLDIRFFDVFAGDHDVTVAFLVGQSGNDVIFVDFLDREVAFKYYRIVKMTNSEMEWQRVGTTFSKGTLGSDFKHFVRIASM